MKRLLGIGVVCFLLCGFAFVPQATMAAAPDPVLEWIGIMNETVIAGQTSPLASTRTTALVSASVFDAVNGIEPRYQPFYVKPAAQQPASKKAAAIQAAFAILLKVYPAQTASLTAHQQASLAALNESPNSIANGVAWGQTVADTIWNIRLTDGNAPPPPPFLGANVLGVWRPTPLLNASGAGPQFATMTPWVLTRPSQFRLPAPLALNSPAFVADVEEVRTMGVFSGSPRTDDESELVLFWAGNTPVAWNGIALELAASHSLSLTEN